MGGYHALLCFKPTEEAYPWLFRKWVAAIDCCISSLLTMPVLGSLECEWLLYFAMFQACWKSLSLALQPVSGCCALLCFKLADTSCSWLTRKWVAAVHCCDSSLLTIPILGSPVCEWLLCLALFQACWEYLFLALQPVSGCCAFLCLKAVDNPCSWLSRMWVPAVTCYV